MEDDANKKGLCQVCHKEMTAINAELGPGTRVYVCEKCLESARENFIWICLQCGSTYIRPKALVLKRLNDPILRRAYAECADQEIIQGIDRCVACEPEAILEFVSAIKSEKQGGHC